MKQNELLKNTIVTDGHITGMITKVKRTVVYVQFPNAEIRYDISYALENFKVVK